MECRNRSRRRSAIAAAILAAVACGDQAAAPAGVPCVGLRLFTLALERSTIVIGESTRGIVVARSCAGTGVSLAALAWESSNPLVASIGPQGEIVAVRAGAAQISATLQGNVASAPVQVVAPVVPAPPASGGLTVQLFSPSVGAVLDDSVRVLASVNPPGPLARVAGTLGPKEFTLRSIPVGAFGGGEAWEARVRINDLAAGNYIVVVRAFSVTGASAADSVIFERRLLNTGGTGTGPSGNKLVAPPVKRP